jgi:hypothetical protein
MSRELVDSLEDQRAQLERKKSDDKLQTQMANQQRME